MSETAPVIKASQVWQGYLLKSHGGFRQRGVYGWALRDVTFAVAPGETLGVLGPNGSGKTTLLQVLAGVLTPTEGTVSRHGRMSALVDLFAGFNRELTGHENLRLGGVITGYSKAMLRSRYDQIVAFTGLSDDKLNQPLRTYSSGMALRLGFSLVVYSEPEILLVDEVLAVGDVHFKEQCAARCKELSAEGAAIVMASHDLRSVADMCDQVMLLDAGAVQFIGPTTEGIQRYEKLLEHRDRVKDPGTDAGPRVRPEPKPPRRPPADTEEAS